MSVEPIQCPTCGAPLTVEHKPDSRYCSHCGASLKISTGSSGHATALAQLDEKLSRQQDQLEGLISQRSEAIVAATARQRKSGAKGKTLKRIAAVFIGVILCGIGLSYGSSLLQGMNYIGLSELALLSVCVFFPIGIGILAFIWAFTRRTAPDTNLEERLAALDSRIGQCKAEIEETQQQRANLQRQMERLTEDL